MVMVATSCSHMAFLLLFASLGLVSVVPVLSEPVSYLQSSPWTWVCQNETCVRKATADLLPLEDGVPLEVCKLNCARDGMIWPKPTGKLELGQGFVAFYPQNLRFTLPFQAPTIEVEQLLQKGSDVFKSYLQKMHPDFSSGGAIFPQNQEIDTVSANSVVITVAVVFTDTQIKLSTDEAYLLSVQLQDDKKTVSVHIQANTYFGARHALETLSHLIAYDDQNNCLQILDRATVQDSPVFAYRGVLIDTSRNFMPMETLRRLVDGMSYNKLNMLHWHIIDSQSFPMYSKSLPQLTRYGAYTPRKIYTIEDMRGLVEYGRVRGVKILAEFDAPAHAGNGWQWGPNEGKGNMVVCLDKTPWPAYCVEPPCGQLNPVNENMYEVLGKIYADMLDIFDNDMFHMGGDEISMSCWNSSSEITDWMMAQGKQLSLDDFLDLWDMFQTRAYKLLTEASKEKNMTTILWTSELTTVEHIEKYLNKSDYAIQIWSTGDDPLIPFLIKKGYRVIFSNHDAWYFDCGYGAWVGAGPNNWCSPYKGWQQVYSNSPFLIYANTTSYAEAEKAVKSGLILGGEAAMWSEQVDENSLEGKIWPRASALAERLWTDPRTNWYAAESRMVHNRQRFVDRGLHPDRLQPEWCHQNEKECFL